MRFELYHPIRPYTVNQAWGVYRPEVYGQFGFNRHNGEDLSLNGPFLYCPMNGVVTHQGYQPTGAGYYLNLLSDVEYDFDDGKRAHVQLTFMHLQQYNCKVGDKVTVGDLFVWGDNTGFSTGPHLHLAAKRVNKTPTGLVEVDKNDANGTFDHSLYYNGKFAEDIYKQKTIAKQIIELYKKLISLLKK